MPCGGRVIRSVRDPRLLSRRAEARELLDSIDTSSVVGLRDRAIIATMAFTFARVSAVVGLKVEDYYAQNKRWWLRLREKNGKVNEMPCHHKLEAISMPISRRPALLIIARGCCSARRSERPGSCQGGR